MPAATSAAATACCERRRSHDEESGDGIEIARLAVLECVMVSAQDRRACGVICGEPRRVGLLEGAIGQPGGQGVALMSETMPGIAATSHTGMMPAAG